MKKNTLIYVLFLFLMVSCGTDSTDNDNLDIDETNDDPITELVETIPAPVAVEISVGSVGRGPLAFGKNPLTVKVGTTVTWTNKDTLEHIISEVYEKFGSNRLKPGQSYSFRFDTLGEFYYYDVRYGYESMSGMIKVVERLNP